MTIQNSGLVASKVQWRLDAVLPARTGKILQSFLDEYESLLLEFEQYRMTLDKSIEAGQFQIILERLEKIARMSSRIGSYSQMFFSEDMRSQEARPFKSRAEEIDVDAANRILFFEHWWKSLDSSKAESLLESSRPFKYYLIRLLQTKPHTLSENVEQVINLKDSMGRVLLLQIYHQIRDSGSYNMKIGELTYEITEEQIRDMFRSPRREERNASYVAFLSKFHSNRDLLGEIYKGVVRDWRNDGIKLRKYSSSIAVRNLANDVPDEVVSTLLQVCRENIGLFQRYYQIKSRLLSIPDFARTDIFGPALNIEEKSYSWEDGVKLILDTFARFDPRFAEFANRVISEAHIDAETRPSKMGGAYCMSVTPEITPYILMSYTGKPKSVTTLAHEFGHAIHSLLSAKATNQLTYEAALPLAETASVFGELLLTDRLMSEADDNVKRSLLVQMIDDAYTTIMRQAFFVMFEMDAHEAISLGVNVDDLSRLYFGNLKSQFGNRVVVQEEFENEWLCIPHIFESPFYCYAYSWGNLLVLSLYKEFRDQGAPDFAPRYLEILSYGGSESPEKILSKAGFNIHSKSFWQIGFDEISNSVSILDSLV